MVLVMMIVPILPQYLTSFGVSQDAIGVLFASKVLTMPSTLFFFF